MNLQPTKPFLNNEKNRMNRTKGFPKISIVTPSLNQGDYLEQTIQSVLSQKYPNLEYVIIDGGSTDNSIEIIRKYSSHLKYWISEPDKGQYDAINKGFQLCSGEIFAWINADDVYFPGSFSIVSEIFAVYPQINWLSSVSHAFIDKNTRIVGAQRSEGYNKKSFYLGRNGAAIPEGGSTYYIMQEATFWRRSLWKAAGGYLNTAYSLAADFELWLRFWKYSTLYCTDAQLSMFRFRSDQRSSTFRAEYTAEAREALLLAGGKIHSRNIRRLCRLFSLVFSRINFINSFKYFYPIVQFDHHSDTWVKKSDHFIY